jgi:uncharacterized RDD family membrane protein YckC
MIVIIIIIIINNVMIIVEESHLFFQFNLLTKTRKLGHQNLQQPLVSMFLLFDRNESNTIE